MKNEKRLKVLEFIADTAQFMEDALFIFTLPRGISFSRAYRALGKRQRRARLDKRVNSKQKLRFNDFLYRLKKDGLVEESKREDGRFLEITAKGKIILQKIKSRILPDNKKYRNEDEGVFKIIIFDVPESEAKKRVWLRCALRHLNFKMLQKSVWAGKAKLPREFLDDLNRTNLFPYVEIFAINKSGSLSQLGMK